MNFFSPLGNAGIAAPKRRVHFLAHLLLFLAALYAAPKSRGQQEEPSVAQPVSQPAAPTVVQYPETEDKFRPLNKVIFAFNHQANRFLITPLSKGYKAALPQPVRTGVGNVFDTIGTPASALNLALQGKGNKSLQQIQRFGINLTLGLAGTHDPATRRFGIPPSNTGFDSTLERYGVGRGSYLVVPFIGSSDGRAFAGLVVDSVLNPLSLLPTPESTYAKVADAFQENAPLAENYLELYRETENAYRFLKNLYEQGRLRDEDYPANE
ncbi:VacJ family lipoprotein [Pelagicoccus sp. SDUM812005]|uniref:MlaA family lipoprotein n=1 Tax=Pelagicoccus sp. SDUM812005 TaxID=3041257 RepID=UPI00280DE435|nr:VacJ family lipoprotein [Pelagicoccus sp. SDUM812005]MDQ8180697.1 VacJ family lipoprotein [Pelagicoccus sp. SDUM812005]